MSKKPDLRTAILNRLYEKHDISQEFVVDQLAIVIKGVQTEENYEMDEFGNFVMTKMKTVKKPSDIMAGLAILDKISHGSLGLDGVQEVGKNTKAIYADYLPTIPSGLPGDVVQRDYVEKTQEELDEE